MSQPENGNLWSPTTRNLIVIVGAAVLFAAAVQASPEAPEGPRDGQAALQAEEAEASEPSEDEAATELAEAADDEAAAESAKPADDEAAAESTKPLEAAESTEPLEDGAAAESTEPLEDEAAAEADERPIPMPEPALALPEPPAPAAAVEDQPLAIPVESVEAPEIAPAAAPAVASRSITFDPLAAPTSVWAKRTVRATAGGELDGQRFDVAFHPLARSGDLLGDWRFGHLIDEAGNGLSHPGGGARVCESPDSSSLLSVDDRLFLVTHLECTPGGMNVTEIRQDGLTGLLEPLWTQPVDFSSVGGGRLFCAGSTTPWGTHLGSEEYEPDSRLANEFGGIREDKPSFNYMLEYHRGDWADATVWDHGWIPEVAVDGEGEASVVKHYAMGRFSHEQAVVMPDRRTVYLSDDERGGGWFLFVADEPGDLSAGELYAARWWQVPHAAHGLVSWIPLGHATDDEIRSFVHDDASPPLRFDDLFELRDADETCPADHPDADGWRLIHTAVGRECLRPREGMSTAASRLETRRYAAYKGATTEFVKAEGIAYDPGSNRVFLATSDVSKGMLDQASGKHDHPDINHIRLPENRCGVVWGAQLAGGVVDGAGLRIDSDYVLSEMVEVVAGRPNPDELDRKNTCDPERISNPDNLSFMPGTDLLIVAEDTSRHENAALWAVDVGEEGLVHHRLLTAPWGAEVSGLNWVGDVDGSAYLLVSIQHPYAIDLIWGDAIGYPGGIPDRGRDGLVGYLGPFPSFGDAEGVAGRL